MSIESTAIFVIVVKGTGRPDEVREHVRSRILGLVQGTARPEATIFDLSDLEFDGPVTLEDALGHAETISPMAQSSMIAYVAHTEERFGIARMYQQAADHVRARLRKVFRTMDDAIAWASGAGTDEDG